jgi:hypothetical protein
VLEPWAIQILVVLREHMGPEGRIEVASQLYH